MYVLLYIQYFPYFIYIASYLYTASYQTCPAVPLQLYIDFPFPVAMMFLCLSLLRNSVHNHSKQVVCPVLSVQLLRKGNGNGFNVGMIIHFIFSPFVIRHKK